MDEDKNYENDSQENVVDSQNEETEHIGSDSQENLDTESNEQAEKNQEVAETDTLEQDQEEGKEEETQSKEDNAIYKKMRLRAEQEAKEKFDKEREKLRAEKEELSRLRQERESYNIEKKIKSELLTEDNIQQVEYNQNVSREIAMKLLESEANQLISSEKQKLTERFNSLQQQKKEISKRKFYNLIEDEVDRIVQTNPNLDYNTAYSYVVGSKYEELQEKLDKDSESRTVANIQDRMKRQPVTSNAQTKKEEGYKLSKEGQEMANVFGIDPKAVSQRVYKNRRK